MSVRHFLTLKDFSHAELSLLMERGLALKTQWKQGSVNNTQAGKTLAMIFEKSSTRTRISFEAGMGQLGGQALFLSPRDTQLGRGEPIEDSARVISSMCDLIMIRTFEHDKLKRFAAFSSKPVINGLTDDFHPCQLLADMLTFYEHRGSIQGKKVAWIGDGNNMCHSYINAAERFGFELSIAAPKGYLPRQDIVEASGAKVTLEESVDRAVSGADLVVTDVWTSMGQEEENAVRLRAFADYQVDTRRLDLASKDALFMHCLPAHRGEEVTSEVMDDPRSVVWDEAENRLHAQKALMEFLLNQR